jgi:hypothetical protein
MSSFLSNPRLVYVRPYLLAADNQPCKETGFYVHSGFFFSAFGEKPEIRMNMDRNLYDHPRLLKLFWSSVSFSMDDQINSFKQTSPFGWVFSLSHRPGEKRADAGKDPT